MARPYDPDFSMAMVRVARAFQNDDSDKDHDASASAAIVAVELISTARFEYKLDSVYTEYSAQYLVDNARPKKKRPHKKKGGRRKKRGPMKQEGTKLELTVKDCLKFALKNGIPKAQDWPPLGSVSKPPSTHKPALVFMKGEVMEAENMLDADELLWDQPVGAKLHVSIPHIDLQQEGIYCGSSGEDSRYVGLRDGIILRVETIGGKLIAVMKLWYKKEFRTVNVAMSRMFCHATHMDAYSVDYSGPGGIEPTFILVDFCALRLSVN